MAELVSRVRAGDDGAVGEATTARDERADRLRDLLTAVDVIPLVARIAPQIGARDDDPPDHVFRYGVEARLQYVAAVGLSVHTRPAAAPDAGDIDEALTLTRDLFDLERALILADTVVEDPYLQRVRVTARLEHLNDRFVNFGRYQREIADAVFPGIESAFTTALGWGPRDYAAVADAAAAMSSTRLGRVSTEAAIRFGGAPASPAEQMAMVDFIDVNLPSIPLFTADELAEVAALPTGTVDAVLRAVGARHGLDPAVRLPTDDNPLRRRSAIDAGHGRWLIPCPYLWLQEWFTVVGEAAAGAGLAEKWHRARDDATERLVAARAAAAFTSSRVHRNLTLIGGEQGEIDVLVDLDDDALFIECKGGSLTPAGRRGAPDRLATRTNDLIGAAFEQIDRGRRHVRGSGVLQPRGRRRLGLGAGAGSSLPAIAVSFERIDPLSMHAAGAAVAGDRWPAMGLGDFLAVCDLLREPARIWHYVRERVRIADLPRIFASSEMEFLGVYLENQELAGLATAQADFMVFVVGYDDVVNRLAAVDPDEFEPPELKHPPAVVIRALSEALRVPCAGWARAADAVHDTRPKDWALLRRLERRYRGGRVAARKLMLPDGSAVSVEPGADATVLPDDKVTVVVPLAPPPPRGARNADVSR